MGKTSLLRSIFNKISGSWSTKNKNNVTFSRPCLQQQDFPINISQNFQPFFGKI